MSHCELNCGLSTVSPSEVVRAAIDKIRARIQEVRLAVAHDQCLVIAEIGVAVFFSPPIGIADKSTITSHSRRHGGIKEWIGQFLAEPLVCAIRVGLAVSSNVNHLRWRPFGGATTLVDSL